MHIANDSVPKSYHGVGYWILSGKSIFRVGIQNKLSDAFKCAWISYVHLKLDHN